MKVEIAVLCYNEAKNLPVLEEALAAVHAAVSGVELNFVIVDNGSLDDTQVAIKPVLERLPFARLLTIPVNQGYGYGVRTALEVLSGDVVGFMWGDNQFDAAVLKPMLETFREQPAVKVVKTYRIKRYDGRLRLLVSKVYQFVFRVLYGIYTHDINSGPKLFRTEFLQKIKPFRSNDWFIDAELMIKSTRNSSLDQIVEFPIAFYPRKFGKSNVRLSTCFQFFWNLIKYKIVNL